MTPEQAKQFLHIIKAFSEGEQIQVDISGDEYPNWMNAADDLLFDGPPSLYRVKPKTKIEKFYYRRFLMFNNYTVKYTIGMCNDKKLEEVFEKTDWFVKWLDPKDNYIEVEVPV